MQPKRKPTLRPKRPSPRTGPSLPGPCEDPTKLNFRVFNKCPNPKIKNKKCLHQTSQNVVIYSSGTMSTFKS